MGQIDLVLTAHPGNAKRDEANDQLLKTVFHENPVFSLQVALRRLSDRIRICALAGCCPVKRTKSSRYGWKELNFL